ncbi:MAG: DNA translocase FtsK [Lachnospiraceae bacterium]|nr:DNA translocase FtsK [Lachnospiraceae bacterium]
MASGSNTTKKKTTSRNNASNSKNTGRKAQSSKTENTKSAGSKAAGTRASGTKSTNSSRTKTKTAAVRAKGAKEQPVIQEQEKANPQIMQEAALWLLLAVCILIFISYFGICGYVGEIISDVSFGVFGIAAYVFPLLLFVAAAFLVSNRGSRIAGLKFGSSLGLYLCVCSLAALLTDGYDTASNFTEIYETCAAKKSGGGVIGGAVCGLLRPALGDIGTGIILVILAIVFLLLITQKSLMRGMKRRSSRVYHSAVESGARMREAHRQERERREEWTLQEQVSDEQSAVYVPSAEMVHQPEPVPTKYTQTGRTPESPAQPVRTQIDVPVLFPVHSRESRADRKVSGVTMDTKLQGNPARVGAEIHEIMPKRTGKTVAADVSEEKTSYIDLEQLSGKKKAGQGADGLEVYQENMEFHIEGIEEEAAEADSSSGLSRSESGDRDLAEEAYYAAKGGKSAEAVFSEPNDLEQAEPEASEADDFEQTGLEASEMNDLGQAGPKASETDVPPEAGSAKAAASKEAPARKNPRSSQKEIEEGIASVEAEMARAAEAVRPEYVYPPLKLLKKGKGKSGGGQEQEIRKTAAKLQQTLDSFGVRVTVTNVSCGPSVTRYELLPEQGVKVSRIVSLSDDIKLNLAAADIRIEAPIPGKAAVGIEVPNAENSAVALRDLLESDEFQKHPSKLAFATGKDIGGKVVVSDIAKMPHLLIAGATGSGKSVCINTLIMSILYKAHPDEVKLIMIDPKVVELSVYNGIPHLFIPVVTDPKKAAGALNWGVAEMTDRYNKFAEFGVRDLKGYNKKIEALKDIEDENKPKKLPQIVIIVDELADLMMVAPGEVEDSICRLAQLARAAGIHLIIATQRPSVNVITGLIKANMPSRIAFSVTSNVDSRTIIDMAGAEKLLGKGDMLFYPQGYQKPARVQGAFVSDEEVSDVVDFLKNKNTDVAYSAEIEEQIAKVQHAVSAARGDEDNDALFADAGKFIIEKDKASIGMLQRVFKIGFNRAARIMDQLSEAGVVGPEEGTKPRKILMSAEEFENYLEQN